MKLRIWAIICVVATAMLAMSSQSYSLTGGTGLYKPSASTSATAVSASSANMIMMRLECPPDNDPDSGDGSQCANPGKTICCNGGGQQGKGPCDPANRGAVECKCNKDGKTDCYPSKYKPLPSCSELMGACTGNVECSVAGNGQQPSSTCVCQGGQFVYCTIPTGSSGGRR